MKIYFVRHGESVANILRVFSNSGYKHPLTEKGVAQAQQLAETLSSKNIRRIYSSPVMRAVQTAEILAKRLKIEMEITEALREWSVGILEGTSDQAGWDLQQQVTEDWFIRHLWETRIPEGESFLEIRERFEPFIHQLLQDEHLKDENIVLLGHGGLYITMLPVIFKNIRRENEFIRVFPNTGYALGEARPDGLYCLEWCGTPIPDLAATSDLENR